MPVVLHAGLNNQLQINKAIRNENSDAFPKWNMKYDNPALSLDYAHKPVIHATTR